jgi:hypothetical protein
MTLLQGIKYVGGPAEGFSYLLKDGDTLFTVPQTLSWVNPQDSNDFGFYVKVEDEYHWKTPDEYSKILACPRCHQHSEFQPADQSFVNVSGVCLQCFGDLAFGEKL